MFEFKINMDDDDYILFNKYDFLNSAVGKKSLMFFRLIIPFFCTMIIFMFIIANSDFLLILIEAIPMTIISILWIGYSKKLILKSMGKSIKKIKKEGKLLYLNETILRFDDEYIHETSPNTESKIKYSLVEKIVVTEKAIYIYSNYIQAYILPLNAFSEEKEKQNFLDFINSKVDKLKI